MRAITILVTCWLTLLAFAPQAAPVRAQARRPLLVIVGSGTDLSDISYADLRSAFLGEPVEYRPGKRLLPFNHAPNSFERDVFDRSVLGLEQSEVGRFWITRRIRDEGTPPRVLPSRDIAVRLVASLPGAITYVDSDEPAAGVRVLTIDGRAPSHPSYLLAP